MSDVNTVNSSSLDRLFFKPVVIRDEPLVQNTSVDRIDSVTVINEDPYLDHVAKQVLLAEGFDSIVLGYGALLNVLIQRAEIRDIKLDLTQAPQELSQAITVLFGQPIKTLSFAKYIDMLKYQQQAAVEHTKTMIDPTNPVVPEFKATPTTHAVEVVKKAFKAMLKDVNAPDLLLSDLILQGSYTAASKKAQVFQTNETSDGKNSLTSPKPDAVADYIKDCIPCLETSTLQLGQWPKHGTWAYFQDTIWKQFLSQLEMLARLKLSLVEFDFGKELCQMTNIFSNFRCLPDLASLLVLVKMMIADITNAMFFNYSLSGGAAINDMIGLVVGPILDAIVALLVQVLNSALSPIECVLDSFKAQLLNVYPTLSSSMSKTLDNLYAGKNKVQNDLYTFVNETNKDWKFKVDKGGETLDLYDNLQSVTRTMNVIGGVIRLFKQVDQVFMMSSGPEKNKALRDICEGSLVAGKPWLSVARIPSLITDTINNPGIKIGENDPGDTVVIDKTIPDSFFDSNDIETFLNDPKYSEIIKSLSSSYDPEDGEDPLALNTDFIQNYIATKQKFKDTLQKVKAIQPQINTPQSVTPTGVPITIVEFGSCLNGTRSGYSQEQINEWISKITG